MWCGGDWQEPKVFTIACINNQLEVIDEATVNTLPESLDEKQIVKFIINGYRI